MMTLCRTYSVETVFALSVRVLCANFGQKFRRVLAHFGITITLIIGSRRAINPLLFITSVAFSEMSQTFLHALEQRGRKIYFEIQKGFSNTTIAQILTPEALKHANNTLF